MYENLKTFNASFTQSIAEKPKVTTYNRTSLSDCLINSQNYGSTTDNFALMEGKPYCSIKVLLLEDNKINQVLAVEMMAMLGINLVDVAENGYEGLEKAKVNQYDLILTDVKMPVMDGIEFTKRIRMIEQYKSVPIIALTANMQQDQVEIYYGVGMNTCLMKPVDINDFERVIELYLT